jgi:hypothetical protein
VQFHRGAFLFRVCVCSLRSAHGLCLGGPVGGWACGTGRAPHEPRLATTITPGGSVPDRPPPLPPPQHATLPSLPYQPVTGRVPLPEGWAAVAVTVWGPARPTVCPQILELLVSVSDLDVSKAQRSVFGDQSRWQEAARRVTSSFGRGVVQLEELQGRWFVAVTIHGPIEKPLDGPPRNTTPRARTWPCSGMAVCLQTHVLWMLRLRDCAWWAVGSMRHNVGPIGKGSAPEVCVGGGRSHPRGPAPFLSHCCCRRQERARQPPDDPCGSNDGAWSAASASPYPAWAPWWGGTQGGHLPQGGVTEFGCVCSEVWCGVCERGGACVQRLHLASLSPRAVPLSCSGVQQAPWWPQAARARHHWGTWPRVPEKESLRS